MRNLPESPIASIASRSMPHILSTSATMLGVCMTVLSLSKLNDDRFSFWVIDKLMALAALMFLASCLCSFHSMRRFDISSIASRFERLAEGVFVAGLIMLAIGAVILAFIVK